MPTALPAQRNKTQREKGDTPSKRGSSLRNYLDQTQSSGSEFGQKEEGESRNTRILELTTWPVRSGRLSAL